MRKASPLALIFCVSCARAFVPMYPGQAKDLIMIARTAELRRSSGVAALRAERAEKEEPGEQEPMDLDLEQMFEVRALL